MENEVKPWDELTPRKRKIIKEIYKNGKCVRRKELQGKLNIKSNIQTTLKTIQDDGYIYHTSPAKVPFLIVAPEGKGSKPIFDELEQIESFLEHSQLLSKLTNTKPITFKDWRRERELVCKRYNLLRGKNKKTIDAVPKLIPTWPCYYWDINPVAFKILERKFGKRPEPKHT